MEDRALWWRMAQSDKMGWCSCCGLRISDGVPPVTGTVPECFQRWRLSACARGMGTDICFWIAKSVALHRDRVQVEDIKSDRYSCLLLRGNVKLQIVLR